MSIEKLVIRLLSTVTPGVLSTPSVNALQGHEPSSPSHHASAPLDFRHDLRVAHDLLAALWSLKISPVGPFT